VLTLGVLYKRIMPTTEELAVNLKAVYKALEPALYPALDILKGHTPPPKSKDDACFFWPWVLKLSGPVKGNIGDAAFDLITNYNLTKELRKKLESVVKWKTHSQRTPEFKSGLATVKSYVDLCRLVEEYQKLIEEGLACPKHEGPQEGLEGFHLVNTGGFDSRVMQALEVKVEEASKLLQDANLGRLVYGKVHVTNALDKQHILAFYSVPTDEMYIRANTPNSDFLSNFLHELGHRFECKFLKPRKGVSDLYAYVKSREAVLSVPPEVGTPFTEMTKRGPRTYVVEDVQKSHITYRAKVSSHNKWRSTVSNWYRLRDRKPDEDGFVSVYASTNPSENYAEMFAAYVQGTLSPKLLPIFEKVTHSKGKSK
jgi:hypothetical protein